MSVRPIPENVACPCFSGEQYGDCCHKLHSGGLAQKPVELMRSRYCAYALHLTEYIIETTDPESPLYEKDLSRFRDDIDKFCRSTKFLGLTILSEDENTVKFLAKLEDMEGRDMSFVEHSLFRKVSGVWKYTKACSLS